MKECSHPEITYTHTTRWESCSRCGQEFMESEINPGMCHCSEWLTDEVEA